MEQELSPIERIAIKWGDKFDADDAAGKFPNVKFAMLDAINEALREVGELRVVFDGPPSHESGRFVECEDAGGRSVNAGEWRERPDGLHELVITSLPAKRP